MATSNSLQDIHPVLGIAHIFDEVVHLKPPDKDARKKVKDVACHRLRLITASDHFSSCGSTVEGCAEYQAGSTSTVKLCAPLDANGWLRRDGLARLDFIGHP